jgi:selenocysteine lyase/cysteine desulfurase
MTISNDFRKKFPVLRTAIYTNTATSGLLSEDLLEWRQEHDLDFLIGGSEAKSKTHLLLKETRKTVAQFFNYSEDDVALVPSFSQGLNLLLEGLPTSEKVLLLRGDYPSLNWPFENRDFRITYEELGENLEERVYNTIKSEGINVFACSAVQWLNGFKMNFDFLKKLKVDFPDLLIIMDGTQFCGSEFFDFADSAIDVLGSSGYKWLLAGYGNGFLIIKHEAQQRFHLKSKGFGSGRNATYQKDGREFCKQLEPGHLDSLAFGSLQFSMKSLMEIGLDSIGEHNGELSKTFKEFALEHELLEPYVAKREHHSTIFNCKGDDVLFQKLVDKNIICAKRGGGIRLSFHFYNTISNVNDVLTIVKSQQ